MKVSPVKSILTNPKAAEFAQNTINAIAVETTLKALGRPTFIYYDKNANGNSKKYAATKEVCILDLLTKSKNQFTDLSKITSSKQKKISKSWIYLILSKNKLMKLKQKRIKKLSMNN